MLLCEIMIPDCMSDKVDCLKSVYTPVRWAARDFGAGEEILVYFSLGVCYNNTSYAALG